MTKSSMNKAEKKRRIIQISALVVAVVMVGSVLLAILIRE